MHKSYASLFCIFAGHNGSSVNVGWRGMPGAWSKELGERKRETGKWESEG